MKTQRVVLYSIERDLDYRDIYPYQVSALPDIYLFQFGALPDIFSYRFGEHYLCLVPPGPLYCPATLPPEILPPAVLRPYTSPHLEQHPDWRSTTGIPASISQSVRRLRVESHHLQRQLNQRSNLRFKKKKKNQFLSNVTKL